MTHCQTPILERCEGKLEWTAGLCHVNKQLADRRFFPCSWSRFVICALITSHSDVAHFTNRTQICLYIILCAQIFTHFEATFMIKGRCLFFFLLYSHQISCIKIWNKKILMTRTTFPKSIAAQSSLLNGNASITLDTISLCHLRCSCIDVNV